QRGLVDLGVHDLRGYTDDRHRTVDDSPYGGGAGMVMKPEPWGAALDDVIDDDSVLIIPNPAGYRFAQQHAHQFAAEDHLVFACGRYEGIDDRVSEHYDRRCRVYELSVGDF